MEKKDNLIEVICRYCGKRVTVKLVKYGDGHVAACPECGKLAYNGK